MVGFRTKTGLFIEDALLVADDFATHSQYLRRSNEAQRVLGAYLRVQTDITVGYVGEWHTHPLPLPPSSTDRDTMRAIALGNSDQTGLIVVALDIELNSVSYHGLVSDLRSGVRKRLGKYRRGTVCFESPELSI